MAAPPGDDRLVATPVRLVAEWHQALNGGDVERLVALTDPDVELVGPRGTTRGAALLREWVGRANLRLVPGQLFHWGNTVVVEEAAEWREGETGAPIGTATVATVFVVRGNRIVTVARHDNLATALGAAGLDASDEADTG